jgi:hypothetical protein
VCNPQSFAICVPSSPITWTDGLSGEVTILRLPFAFLEVGERYGDFSANWHEGALTTAL